MKKCRALSLANLVTYMEKKKSKLRKLKRSYVTKENKTNSIPKECFRISRRS